MDELMPDAEVILGAFDGARAYFVESLEAAGLSADAMAVVGELADASRDVLEDALEGDVPLEDALDHAATIIDLAIPLQLLLPGLIGESAEEHDRDVILRILTLLVSAVVADPDRLRERAGELMVVAAELTAESVEHALHADIFAGTKPRKAKRLARRSDRKAKRSDRKEDNATAKLARADVLDPIFDKDGDGN